MEDLRSDAAACIGSEHQARALNSLYDKSRMCVKDPSQMNRSLKTKEGERESAAKQVECCVSRDQYCLADRLPLQARQEVSFFFYTVIEFQLSVHMHNMRTLHLIDPSLRLSMSSRPPSMTFSAIQCDVTRLLLVLPTIGNNNCICSLLMNDRLVL